MRVKNKIKKDPIWIRDPDKAFFIQTTISLIALAISLIAIFVKMLNR